MSSLYDEPSAIELLEAVEEFLRNDVMPVSDGSLKYHARVAANILKLVSRELDAGPTPEQSFQDELEDLGFQDRTELAKAIRDGRIDARNQDLFAAIELWVHRKLQVSNPTYFDDK
jgi:NAD(P)H-dependent FMN reductase